MYIHFFTSLDPDINFETLVASGSCNRMMCFKMYVEQWVRQDGYEVVWFIFLKDISLVLNRSTCRIPNCLRCRQRNYAKNFKLCQTSILWKIFYLTSIHVNPTPGHTTVFCCVWFRCQLFARTRRRENINERAERCVEQETGRLMIWLRFTVPRPTIQSSNFTELCRISVCMSEY